MAKFLLKIASLSIISIIVVVGIFLYTRDGNNPQYGFLKGHLIKQERLATSTSPRIILCGGSNLAFGIDTELIQSKTGLTVINMGLQRGLGLSYMLHELKGKIHENDIVIFSIEFDYYYEKQLDGFTPLFMIENNLENLNYFKNKADLNRIVNFTPRFLQMKMNALFLNFVPPNNTIYHENAFNQYGDVISHLDIESSPKNLDYNVFDLDYNMNTIDLINTFISQNKGLKTYTVFPSFIKSNYDIHQKEIEKLYMFINNNSTSKLLGKADSFVLPNKYFFDSVYHLNKEGRKIRSEKFAEMINSL